LKETAFISGIFLGNADCCWVSS